jgi:gas vesicle protein
MKGGVRVNNCVPIEEEKPGLYANVNAKRERIKHGSGEHMRKPGTKGAPTAQAWRDAAKTAKTESSIMRGMLEAALSEEELLLAPGQGVKFRTELMPKRTDHEVEMARNQLRSSFENAKEIYHTIEDLSEMQGLDGWVQAKITKASDYLEAVNQYLKGKKQMLEKELEVAEDQIDDTLTAQYNTPQMKAQNQAVDQAFASNDSKQLRSMGIIPPDQIEQDYQTMRAGEKAQDAAVYANPKLTPGARTMPPTAMKTNPRGVPIRETEKLSAHEKFKRGVKKAGYDMDAGADRLLNLIARQAEERKERERKEAEQDAAFYGRKK